MKAMKGMKEKNCNDQLTDCVKECTKNHDIPHCLRMCKPLKDECDKK